MTFAQRRNRITTHFSERITVVKQSSTVNFLLTNNFLTFRKGKKSHSTKSGRQRGCGITFVCFTARNSGRGKVEQVSVGGNLATVQYKSDCLPKCSGLKYIKFLTCKQIHIEWFLFLKTTSFTWSTFNLFHLLVAVQSIQNLTRSQDISKLSK